MTARYFGVNSLAGCFRSGTSVKEDTTAGRFDSTYVPNAILIPSGETATIKAPFLDGTTSFTSTFYVRFDVFANNYNGSAPLLLMLNGGANAYRINASASSAVQVQYWNSGTSAWVNWGSAATITNGALSTAVLKLTPNVGFELFVAGSSAASSAVVPTNGAAAVDELRFGAVNSTGTGTYVSQIMGADYDIRDSHLMRAALNGNSATNTGGTGSYTDVNETVLDESTAIVVATVGNKMGQTKTGITVPGGMGIGALVMNARGRVSGGTVTDGKLGVRSGGANYSSSSRGYNGGYEPRGYAWAADPATSVAWTQTTFNSAEDYLEAA